MTLKDFLKLTLDGRSILIIWKSKNFTPMCREKIMAHYPELLDIEVIHVFVFNYDINRPVLAIKLDQSVGVMKDEQRKIF